MFSMEFQYTPATETKCVVTRMEDFFLWTSICSKEASRLERVWVWVVLRVTSHCPANH